MSESPQIKVGNCVVFTTAITEPDSGSVIHEQFHGLVAAISPGAGVIIDLGGVNSGQQYALARAALDQFKPAPGKGEFTLSETGEIVKDPDFIAFFDWTHKTDDNE